MTEKTNLYAFITNRLRFGR